MNPDGTNKLRYLNRYLKGIQSQIIRLPAEDTMDPTLLDDICSLRGRHVKTSREPEVWLAFYGFGSNRKKILCFRLLRYALAPYFLFGSTVANNRWEAMMLLDKWRPAVDDLQSLCDKFRMSIGITELGSYLGAGMVTCYERINKGTLLFGSLYLPRNRRHHMNLEACVEQKKEQERTRIAEEEMGVPFSLRNMLAMHRTIRNLEVEHAEMVQSSEDLCRHVLGVLCSMNVLNSMMSNATQIEYGRIDAHSIHAATEENRVDVVRSHITQNIQDLENITARLQILQRSPPDVRWTVLAGWSLVGRPD